MTRENINITAMPYFPGVASGQLHTGWDGDIADGVVMLSEKELCHVINSLVFHHRQDYI